MVEWRFPSNDNGQINGINDSGMNYFTGNKLKSLAREICQNSLDAGLGGTVRVEFDDFIIDSKDLPGRNDLAYAYNKSLEFWKDQKDKNTKNFFTKALEVINGENIKVLRISDFSTCGLTGAHKEWNTNWSNLIKASGASDKNGVAGGSFGIGKYATFACSDLRTVFYSTIDETGVIASQGVSRLVTFTRKDGEKTQGIGYYGDSNKNMPVFEGLNLHDGYKRDEPGTDIYVAGYSFEDSWSDDMITAIIEDFMVAILEGKLEVKIGKVLITKDTFSAIINKYKDKIHKVAFDSYKVMTSSNTIWFNDDFMSMGRVKLGLLLEDELNKKVSMVRQNGMRIFDQSGVNPNVQFAGVLLIEGHDINEFLRKLENPKHDKWEPDRSTNKKFAKSVLKNLKMFLKEKLNDLIASQPDEALDAEGIGEFLPDETDEDAKNKTESDAITDDVKKVEVVVKDRKPKPASAKSQEDDSEENNESGGLDDDGDQDYSHPGGAGGGGGRTPDKEPKDGDNDDKKSTFRKLVPQKIKVIVLSKLRNEYSAIITPDASYENCELCLMLSGETRTFPLNIVSARALDGEKVEVSNNKLKGLTLYKSVQKKIIFSIDYDDYCGMEVELYGNKI